MYRLKTEGYQYFNKDLLKEFGIEVDHNLWQVIRIIGYLINMKSMQKAEKLLGIEQSEPILDFIELYKKCWSSYTHLLFNKLCKSGQFIRIFKIFYDGFKGNNTNRAFSGDLKADLTKVESLKYESESHHESTAIRNLKKFKPVNSNLDKYLEKIESLALMLREYS